MLFQQRKALFNGQFGANENYSSIFLSIDCKLFFFCASLELFTAIRAEFIKKFVLVYSNDGRAMMMMNYLIMLLYNQ